jgi:hypothetical protein
LDPDSNPDSNPDPKCLFRIRIGSGQKFRILTDPDPQHCKYGYYGKSNTEDWKNCQVRVPTGRAIRNIGKIVKYGYLREEQYGRLEKLSSTGTYGKSNTEDWKNSQVRVPTGRAIRKIGKIVKYGYLREEQYGRLEKLSSTGTYGKSNTEESFVIL